VNILAVILPDRARGPGISQRIQSFLGRLLKKGFWWEKNFKRTGDFVIQAKLAMEAHLVRSRNPELFELFLEQNTGPRILD
jgi:hypothetical protein